MPVYMALLLALGETVQRYELWRRNARYASYASHLRGCVGGSQGARGQLLLLRDNYAELYMHARHCDGAPAP